MSYVVACLELGRDLHVHGHRCVRHHDLEQGGEDQDVWSHQSLGD